MILIELESSNQGLSEQEVGNCQPSLAEIIRRGQQALTRIERGHWSDWRDVVLTLSAGRSLVLHETKANNVQSSRYRKAMGVWLRCYGFDRIHKADRCRLFECADNLEAIDGWLASLPPERQLGLNHPRVVLTHWKRSLRPARDKADTASKPEEVGPHLALVAALHDVTLEECLRAMPQSWRNALEQRVTEHLSVERLLELLESKIEHTPKTRAALKDIRKALRRPQLELVAIEAVV